MSFRRRLVPGALAVAVAIAAATTGDRRLSAQGGMAPTRDLAALFEPGSLLQDRNGDGVIDFVAGRVVTGGSPDAATVAAAASVGARLGFETSAMDLPVAGAGDGLVIAVGTPALQSLGIAAPPEAGLVAGQGAVAVLDTGGRPVVAVWGVDAAGVRAAATVLAARLPRVWAPKGTTLGEVRDAARSTLTAAGVDVRSVTVRGVVAAGDADELTRIMLRVELPSARDVTTARTALGRLRAAAAPPPTSSADSKAQTAALSFPGAASIRVELAVAGAAPVSVDVPRASPPPVREPLGRRAGGAKENLDLSTLYAIEGLLGDSDSNLIPDRLDALLTPSGAGTEKTIDLAARLGLESAGVALPIAAEGAAIARPEQEPSLVIIGTTHPLLDRLTKDGKYRAPALAPGDGLIQIVSKAFGEKGAVVITGGDAAGLSRALEQTAERLPHLWARGKDRPTIEDVEDDVRRFVAARSPAGQAATTLYKLERVGASLSSTPLERAHVKVFVEKAAPGLDRVVRAVAQQALKAATIDVTVEDLDVQRAKPIITDEFTVASEVDELRAAVKAAWPKVQRGRPVVLTAGVSESPEIRRQLETELRAGLIKAGASDAGTRVTVLSAYKQGFSWLNDVVKPALASARADEIEIRFAEIGPPPEWTQQAMFTPTRWLLELFPIDEVLARDLKIDLSRIRFVKAPIGTSPVYQVTAKAGGAEVFRGGFDPTFVVRPYFDRFPDYEKVRVTTGWVRAASGDRPILDQRIVTDLERFWDHYQSKTLPAIYDYAMTLGEGKLRPEDAPHFGELTFDVTLSEPEYQLGIDKEHIAPMESLHEELYFATLHFFDVLGRNTRGRPFDYPGRVIPIVRPVQTGAAGRATITMTGFGASRPGVVVEYTERGGRTGKASLDAVPVAIQRPSAVSAAVRAGREGLERLDVFVKVDTEQDERDVLIRRARRDRVDGQIISLAQVRAMIAHLGRLRAAGLYADALTYHGLGSLRVVAGLDFLPRLEGDTVIALGSDGAKPAPFPDIRTMLPSGPPASGAPLVQWETPIPPNEAYGILARMSTFAEATVYKVGESYLGKNVWAMDLMPPVRATHWSQAKATTLKPTVVYSARQHANEVSSTSHTLKLAELLLTDPAYRKLLDKVNVVFHPITNADGAQLAYDLYKITPNHMLHAGYLGSLGVDMTSAQWDPDPIYPEAGIRPKIWRTWLPDIFLNPHGYPSHEWVQLFSEYAGWVRNRVTEGRDWWGMRGWFTPGFAFVDDPKFPRHKGAAFEIRDRFSRNINAASEVRALNERAYARYRRYGFDQDDENFKLDFTNDVLIYSALKGARQSASSQDFMTRNPNVTIWTGGTEAPDETAYGDWMTLVATAGLQWDKAILAYLAEGRHAIDRNETAFHGGVSLALSRARPPKPPAKDDQPASVTEGAASR